MSKASIGIGENDVYKLKVQSINLRRVSSGSCLAFYKYNGSSEHSSQNWVALMAVMLTNSDHQ